MCLLAVAALALLACAASPQPVAAEPPTRDATPHVPVDSMGDASWTTVPQVGLAGFRPDEAAWRRWLRRPGPLGWPLLGAVLALALLGGRVRRKPGRNSVALLLVVVTLFAVSGALAHRVVLRLLPPPPLLRGAVQRAPHEPPPGHRVVYAWGESTMHGDVWGPFLSIPKVIGWSLRHTLGGAPLSVQNLAEPGTSLTRGYPAQLDPIFKDTARYRPAAVVVYVGHNAYYNLPKRWDDPVAERAHVEAVVQRHLRTLAERAARAEVPVFVALPVANLEGHPPMGPRHGSGVSPSDQRAYEAHLDAAASAATPQAALASLDAALRVSPQHAWASFRRGQRLRALGRDQEARLAFAQAVELDHDRQRALPSHRAAIRQLCESTWLRCVDAEAAVRAWHPWLDDQIFIDIHHPVAAGHVAIGEAFARAIARHAGAPPPRRVDLRHPPAALDPRPATADRLLQTAGWYLVLAHELRGGYPRSKRAALARAAANIAVLRAALPQLPGQGADVAPSVAVLELLAAALRGDAAATRRRWNAIRDSYDWRDARHPLPEPWMRTLVGEILGLDTLGPPPKG